VLLKLLRLGEGRTVRNLQAVATHVGTFSAAAEGLADAELRAKTDEFKKRAAAGEKLDDLLPEAFAVAREAAWRVLSLRPFDVQVMGGAALHFGYIAEMKTGEGKTLACVLPAYLNALAGKGVHVVTVNDYLAKRDSEWMGRVHRFLGLDVGVILARMKPHERRSAYASDITYGTNSEFGFDYLRDNMARSREDLVQRGQSYAIVDEVDSILIDEARTPLIISGPGDEASHWYAEFARLAALMRQHTHYEVDLRRRAVGVDEQGVAFVEDQLGIDNLYGLDNSPLVSYLNTALRAKELFRCDRDYIVTPKGEVLIVDEFTGRVLFGRRYNEGLHQAIEAKEGVAIKAENQTLATITLQNYFRLYDKLAGMSGTARSEASEFRDTYRLGVVAITRHKPMARRDNPDVVYKTELAKFNAVVDDIAERYAKAQPVLIGTASVEKSEYLSRRLTQLRIPHAVLNAKHLEQEAAIVAQAGRRGAITVATDMAGRGTDIVLGGHVDFLTDQRLRDEGLHPVETFDEYQQAWREERPKVKGEAAAEAREVAALGGLYVIGTERHESRRVDDQLRGRSGRQGDPGETRFYVSLGDEMIRRFSVVNLEKLMTRLKMPENEPIRALAIAREIESAQIQIEQKNFQLRKNVLKYDEVINRQRKVVYAARWRTLRGDDLKQQFQRMLVDVITAYVEGATHGKRAKEWDLEKLFTALKTLYPVGIEPRSMGHAHASQRVAHPTRQELLDSLIEDAERAFERREAEVKAIAGQGVMRQLERDVSLDAIDCNWREHLAAMDYLKQGIRLRALAQQDPIVEFQRDGYDMFRGMIDELEEQCVASIFKAEAESMPTAEQFTGGT